MRDKRAERLQRHGAGKIGVAIGDLGRGKPPGIGQPADRFQPGRDRQLKQPASSFPALAPRMNGEEGARRSRRNGFGPVVLEAQILKRAIAADLQGRRPQSAQGHAQWCAQGALVGNPVRPVSVGRAA